MPHDNNIKKIKRYVHVNTQKTRMEKRKKKDDKEGEEYDKQEEEDGEEEGK